MSRIGPQHGLPPMERGVDRIVRDTGGPSGLPEFVDLAPNESPAQSRLDQLLSLPCIDGYVAEALRPPLHGSAILSPAAFRATLESALEALRGSAVAHPRAARSLGRAARLLADEASLRDLLLMYRWALLQG